MLVPRPDVVKDNASPYMFVCQLEYRQSRLIRGQGTPEHYQEVTLREQLNMRYYRLQNAGVDKFQFYLSMAL